MAPPAPPANFDEKVHKPQYYRTLAVARVIKANHAENKKCLVFKDRDSPVKCLVTKYIFLNIFYMFCFFYPEAHNLSRRQKNQATLYTYLGSDFTEMLQ